MTNLRDKRKDLRPKKLLQYKDGNTTNIIESNFGKDNLFSRSKKYSKSSCNMNSPYKFMYSSIKDIYECCGHYISQKK